MNLWKQTSVWEKINHTAQLFGTGGQLTLIANHANPIWNYISGGAQVLVLIVSIWMEDRDKNGIVDLFEPTETTTEVKLKTTAVPGEPAKTKVVDVTTEITKP